MQRKHLKRRPSIGLMKDRGEQVSVSHHAAPGIAFREGALSTSIRNFSDI